MDTISLLLLGDTPFTVPAAEDIEVTRVPDVEAAMADAEDVDVAMGSPAGDVDTLIRSVREELPGTPLLVVVPDEMTVPTEHLQPGTVDYIEAETATEAPSVLGHRLRSLVGAPMADSGDTRHMEFALDGTVQTLAGAIDEAADLGRRGDREALLDHLLAIGTEELGFPIGYVTRIESGTQEIIAAAGDHELIQPGATDPLEQTYCRKTIQADEPLVVTDAPDEGWEGDPAYEQFGLRCYVGATITVGDEVFGTVCFADERHREEILADVQQTTIKTLATIIGYEIERDQREATLTKRTARLRELFDSAPDGIVIHDEQGDVIDVNQQLAEELGYDRTELLSMTVPDFEVGLDLEYLKEAWATTDGDDPLVVEGKHERKDGSTYPVEVWVSRIEDNGRFIAICRDISHRLARERELRRYADLWQNLPVGVCEVDPRGDGEFLSVNDTLVEIAGAQSREELLDQSIAALWQNEDERDDVREEVRETGTATVEHRFRTLDDRIVWLRLILMAREAEPVVDVVVEDITERREREIHLEEAQEVGDIGWWRKDIPSDQIYWSERVYNMWGAEGDVGLIDHEVFMSFIHPGDEEFVGEAWEAALDGDPYDIEHRIITGDDETRWMREKAELTFEDGEPVSAIGIVQDITDRKERERKLKDTQDTLRQVIDLVPDIIFAKTKSGEYVLANEALADAYELDVKDIEGKTDYDLLPDPDEADAFRTDDLEVIESGTDRTIEETLTTAEGKEIKLQTTKIPFDPPTVDEPAVLGYGRDVTDLKEYQDRLRRHRDSLAVLNQVIRHDIRNDLQIIQGRAELLDPHIDAEGGDHLREILNSTQAAIELTKTARDLSQALEPDSDQYGPVDLGNRLRAAVESMESVHGHADFELTIEDTPTVPANELIDAVFRNLLQNAVLHNDSDTPEVDVTLIGDEDTARVIVADNGPGVPDDMKAQIFGKGEQGLDSPGTGLGLYLVDTVIDQFDGEVWVEDNEPEGAKFVVELPVVE